MKSGEKMGIVVVIVFLALAGYFAVDLFLSDSGQEQPLDEPEIVEDGSGRDAQQVTSVIEGGQAIDDAGASGQGGQDREKVAGTTRHATVSGRVVDNKGKPIRNATVSLHRGSNLLAFHIAVDSESVVDGKTGKDGRYDLVVTSEAGEYTVVARHPKYSEAFFSPLKIRMDEKTRAPDLVLGSGSTIRGCVADTNGQPIEGARVSILDASSPIPKKNADGASDLSTVTDASGQYAFSNLSLRTFKITAAAEGYATQQQAGNMIFQKIREKVIDFRLHPGVSIAGFVNDVAGAPIEGAEIKATLFSTKDFGSFGTTRSDAKGAFSVDDLADGTYTVSITCAGYSDVVKKRIKGGTQDLEVTLKKQGGITGVVSDGQTRDPVRKFQIRVMHRTKRGNKETMRPSGIVQKFETKDGRYTMEGLNPGACHLLVSAAGYADSLSEEIVVSRETVVDKVDIFMDKGGDLRGRVVNGEGSPIRGAKIMLADKARQEDPLSQVFNTMLNPTGGRAKKQGTTDENGAFHLTLITPGKYAVDVTHPDYAMTSPKWVEVLPGEGTTPMMEDITLTRGGKVTGRVFDGKKNPLASALVAITSEKGHMERTTTDENGKYLFEHLRPGEYTVFWQMTTSKNRDIETLLKNIDDVEGTKTKVFVTEGGEQKVDIYLSH